MPIDGSEGFVRDEEDLLTMGIHTADEVVKEWKKFGEHDTPFLKRVCKCKLKSPLLPDQSINPPYLYSTDAP